MFIYVCLKCRLFILKNFLTYFVFHRLVLYGKFFKIENVCLCFWHLLWIASLSQMPSFHFSHLFASFHPMELGGMQRKFHKIRFFCHNLASTVCPRSCDPILYSKLLYKITPFWTCTCYWRKTLCLPVAVLWTIFLLSIKMMRFLP